MDWFSSTQPPGSDHSPLRHEDPAFFIEDGRTSVEFRRRISGAEQSTHLSGRRINLRGEHVDRHRADTLVALPVEGVLAVHQSGLGQRLQFSGLFQ